MSQTIPDLGDEPLSITQLCERLGRTRPTIYRYMAMTDPLPSSRPSPINAHRRMFDPREVEAWLARNRCSDPCDGCGCLPPAHSEDCPAEFLANLTTKHDPDRLAS